MPIKLGNITHVVLDVDGTLYEKKREYIPGRGTIEDRHEYFRYATYCKAVDEGGIYEEDIFIAQLVSEYLRLEDDGRLLDAVEEFPNDFKQHYHSLVKKHTANGRLFRNEFGVQAGFFHRILQHIAFGSVLEEDERLQDTLDAVFKKGYQGSVLTSERYATIEAAFAALGLRIGDYALDTGTDFPIFCSDNLGKDTKPSPAAFERLLEVVDAEPGQVVYVGDSLKKDVIPPLELGMKAVHVTWKGNEIVERDGYIEIPTIYDLREVVKIVGEEV